MFHGKPCVMLAKSIMVGASQTIGTDAVCQFCITIIQKTSVSATTFRHLEHTTLHPLAPSRTTRHSSTGCPSLKTPRYLASMKMPTRINSKKHANNGDCERAAAKVDGL
eukprot:12437_6